MEVCDENAPNAEPSLEAHHLALCTLTAVEQHQLAVALHGECAHVATDRGTRRGGAQERDSDHVMRCRSVRSRSPDSDLNADGSAWLRKPTLVEDHGIGDIVDGEQSLEPGKGPSAHTKDTTHAHIARGARVERLEPSELRVFTVLFATIRECRSTGERAGKPCLA